MPARPKPSIVVVGSSNTDMIVTARRIPMPGETIIGGEFHLAAGGKGANQAVAAARAGGRVTFVGRVGRDVFGQRALAGFAKDGLDVRHVIRDPMAASGVALIVVSRDGENSIAVASGANARLSPADVDRAGTAIAGARVLLVQLETPLPAVRRAIRIALRRRVPIILNPAPARRLAGEILGQIDFLTPNETETELLTGIRIRGEADLRRAAKLLSSRGVRNVLITMGARGVFVRTPDGQGIIPAFKVKAVDTTAAGDVFNGALAVALAERRPMFEAVRFAAAAAAISVTHLGAQPSAPRRGEIERMMKSGRRAPGSISPGSKGGIP